MSMRGAGVQAESKAPVLVPAVISMSMKEVVGNGDGTLTYILSYGVARTKLPSDYPYGEIRVAPSDPVLKEDLKLQAAELIAGHMSVRWWQFLRWRKILKSSKMKDDSRTGHYFIEVTVSDV